MSKGFQGGGFGGGNMQQLLKQAQKMQQDMAKAQEELASKEVVGSAGGMVDVTLLGNKTVASIKIKPDAVDPNDVEMLEDLIIAAFNEALSKVDELSQEVLGPMAGGMGGLL
ncbi:MAG: YbaB/EbfC family nucleoid-associated protein [Clostridia bacterium]